MTCKDCGFEHNGTGACPRCGFEASVDLLAAVKTPGAPVANPLETEFSKMCADAQAGKTSAERVRQHWATLNERAKVGNKDARHLVARVLLSRPEDAGTARSILESLAASGHALAMIDLAKIYETGAGVEKDTFRAIRLYRQAAALGSPLALFTIAQHHQEGGLLEPDPAFARSLMEALATAHPTMFKRQGGGCSCAQANPISEKDFAKKTVGQVAWLFKAAVILGIIALAVSLLRS